jgi:hypothetical protein
MMLNMYSGRAFTATAGTVGIAAAAYRAVVRITASTIAALATDTSTVHYYFEIRNVFMYRDEAGQL